MDGIYLQADDGVDESTGCDGVGRWFVLLILASLIATVRLKLIDDDTAGI